MTQATKNKSKTKKSRSLKNPVSKPPKEVHPWRLCPYGRHWVTTHPLHTPPSKRNPAGGVTTRHGHCADNPSHKDYLYPDEIHEISSQHFSDLNTKPCPNSLAFPNGDKFDDLIAGWTKYWNDVFQPKERLDPNLIKALIGSESGFRPKKLFNPKNSNSARGLMQITNDTRKILGNRLGELKEHYLAVTKEDLNDPSTNICAGIRWLFQKKALTSSHLKRDASWIETVHDYKGAATVSRVRARELMKSFEDKYKALQKCRK